MGREEMRGIAAALLDRAVHCIFDHGGIGERGSRQRLSQVDPLALPCAPGVAKRRCDGKGRADASGGIGIAGADARWFAIRPTRQVNDARLRFLHGTIGHVVFIGAAMPETRHRTVDDTRVDLAQAVIVEADGLHTARAEIFQHYVTHGDQAGDNLARLLAFHVQVDAVFAAVMCIPVAARIETAILKGKWWVVAHDIHAFAALDLDHLHTQVAEQLPAVWPRKHPREINAAKSCQCVL